MFKQVDWAVFMQMSGQSLTMTKHAQRLFCYTKYTLNAVSIQQKHHVLTNVLTATLYSRSNSSMSVADTPGWIMPQSI